MVNAMVYDLSSLITTTDLILLHNVNENKRDSLSALTLFKVQTTRPSEMILGQNSSRKNN